MTGSNVELFPQKHQRTPVVIEKIIRPILARKHLQEYPVEAKDFSSDKKKFEESLESVSYSKDDYSEGQLDLNDHLLRNPDSTFFVRVSGDSMIDVGIHPGDLLVVDRSLRPSNGSIVIAVLMGSLTVKKLLREAGKLYLVPENPHYSCIEVKENMDCMIWGVVTHVIHAL